MKVQRIKNTNDGEAFLIFTKRFLWLLLGMANHCSPAQLAATYLKMKLGSKIVKTPDELLEI